MGGKTIDRYDKHRLIRNIMIQEYSLGFSGGYTSYEKS